MSLMVVLKLGPAQTVEWLNDFIPTVDEVLTARRWLLLASMRGYFSGASQSTLDKGFVRSTPSRRQEGYGRTCPACRPTTS